MAKTYTDPQDTFTDFIDNFNDLTNKVGDLSNLNTSEDSSVVGAINAALDEANTDSAGVTSVLVNGQYLNFIDLTANTDSDLVLTFGQQTISGLKSFLDNISVGDSDGKVVISSSSRQSVSNNLTITHDSSGSHIKWEGSGADQNIISFVGDSSDNIESIRFNIGAEFVGSLDKAADISSNSFLNRSQLDSRYLLDSNTVSTSNLIDESITYAKMDQNLLSGADSSVITGVAGIGGNLALWRVGGDLEDGPSISAVIGDDSSSVPTTKAVNDQIETRIPTVAGIGFNPTGTIKTVSRSKTTAHQNTTGYVIMMFVIGRGSSSANMSIQASINGSTWVQVGNHGQSDLGNGYNGNTTFVLYPGHYWRYTGGGTPNVREYS